MILEKFAVGSANTKLLPNDALNRALAIALESASVPNYQRVKETSSISLTRAVFQPSLPISGELHPFMASSASGLIPAVQTVVDLPDQTNAPS